MPVVKAASKGQNVIPKEIGEKLGIYPGTRLLLPVVEDHAEITLIPDNPIGAMREILKGGNSLANELVAERKKENRIDKGRRF